MANNLDGGRVRQHIGAEVDALLATYHQFARLVPSETTAGAANRGEDGRYVEALLRTYLRKFLPAALEVSSGFILRPAVKTGVNGKERKGKKDSHSTQIDILVHDNMNYPIFQRFGDNVIVPPEGVIAIISVKKHLRKQDITDECISLREAAKVCVCLGVDEVPLRGPFLALIGMHATDLGPVDSYGRSLFVQIQAAYTGKKEPLSFDEIVGYVGTMGEISVFKARPTPVDKPKEAKFVEIRHKSEERHWGLQMILTGILSVYFDPTRNRRRRPGFSGFESGRKHDAELGSIKVSRLR